MDESLICIRYIGVAEYLRTNSNMERIIADLNVCSKYNW